MQIHVWRARRTTSPNLKQKLATQPTTCLRRRRLIFRIRMHDDMLMHTCLHNFDVIKAWAWPSPTAAKTMLSMQIPSSGLFWAGLFWTVGVFLKFILGHLLVSQRKQWYQDEKRKKTHDKTKTNENNEKTTTKGGVARHCIRRKHAWDQQKQFIVYTNWCTVLLLWPHHDLGLQMLNVLPQYQPAGTICMPKQATAVPCVQATELSLLSTCRFYLLA